MLNSIVIKDPHFKFGFRVAHRYSFEQDIEDKLQQILEYKDEHLVDSLIIPGDIFDESYENKWTFSHYARNIQILEPFFKKFKNVYTIPGNHDYFNGFESEIKRGDNNIIEKTTMYGEFVRQGIFTNVSFPNVVHVDNVVITGVKYSSDLNKISSQLQKINDQYQDKFVIVMLHQNVTPKPVKNITEFSYNGLASKYHNINVFCLGHYHIGYKTQKINNTLFINPWNLTRVTRDYEVKIDKHVPSFTHITIDDNLNVQHTDVALQVKSFDTAFKPEYRSILELISKQTNVDLNIDESIINNKLSDTDIIQQILDENIKDESRKLEVLNVVKGYVEHTLKD